MSVCVAPVFDGLMKSGSVFAGFLVASVLLASAEDASPDLTIRGSDTLGAKMIPRLAEAYRSEVVGEDFRFVIEAEGSRTAFTCLLARTADIGMASRPIKPEEQARFEEAGIEWEEIPIAIDLIAVIVHQENPVDGLTREQVEAIFTSETTNWDEVGGKPEPIEVFTRNTSSGTYRTFQRLAMSGRDYGRRTQKVAGAFHPSDVISPNRRSIGYVGLFFTDIEGIKTLAIDGVLPSQETRLDYPIARRLFLYLPQPAKPEARDFVDWILADPTAHETVERVGFLPYRTPSDGAKDD